CFCGNRFYQDPVDADQKMAAHRVRIMATRNIAHSSQYFCFGEYVRGRTHKLETLTDWFRDHITWEGRDNLLPVDQLDSFLYFRQHDLTGKGEARRWKTLQDWQAFWKSSKVLGSQGTPRFIGGDPLDRVSSKEEKIAPADFRLEKGSPGEGLGGDV